MLDALNLSTQKLLGTLRKARGKLKREKELATVPANAVAQGGTSKRRLPQRCHSIYALNQEIFVVFSMEFLPS